MTQETFTFQAEIKQLLDILVHSLYTEREIFLRELISNASDALNRVQFELLTNRDVVDPDVELKIHITVDAEAGTITISDTGIGMTREDLVNNLGTIARSGAKAFIDAMKDAKEGSASAQEVIGQFGVGFYSVFMIADEVRVISRSHLPEESAVEWVSDGSSEYTIEESDRESRGTDIIVYLKEEAKEDFLKPWTIKGIIREHSDYIAFPIYVEDDEEPTNKRIAIWRRNPQDVEDTEYADFYKMMTMDFNQPAHHIHMRADVPLQFYALLYVPGSTEQNMFSPRKEPGLKLYARKVLIQEYNKDLLPEFLQFVQGVVDSEDLPLNVSRESVQANRVMANLQKTLKNKVLTELKRMAKKKTDEYLKIFENFGRYLKQGIVASPEDRADLEALVFFNSTHDDNHESFWSLEQYVERMSENQDDIYYIIGEDFHSARRSPHLDSFRQRGIEVLYFTDPVDNVMTMGLTEYKGHKLRNVDEADIDLSEVGEVTEDESTPQREALDETTFEHVRERFVDVLGERVRGVRASKSLTGSPARLVSDDASANRNMFRINRLLDKDYDLPVKLLELNPRHQLLHNLRTLLDNDGDERLIDAVVEQIFETALLLDGIHPDPASMANRLNLLMQAATGSAVNDLDFTETGSVIPEPEPSTGMPNMADFGFDPANMPDFGDMDDIDPESATEQVIIDGDSDDDVEEVIIDGDNETE